VPARRFNRYAIAAVVCGILWPLAAPALLLGYEARIKISESGGTQRGSGLATTAIVLGWAQAAALAVIAVWAVVGAAVFFWRGDG